MKKIRSCEFNMDTGCVELRFADILRQSRILNCAVSIYRFFILSGPARSVGCAGRSSL